MARPTKSVDVMSKHLTKEEIETRKQNEEKLKGDTDKIKAPIWLNKNQKKIFKFILEELKVTGILSNKDLYILTQGAVIIDRLEELEKKINAEFENVYDKRLMVARNSYMRDFFRYCNELCLSPQSRAKISNMIKDSEKEDPLLKLLSEDEGDNINDDS